MIAGTIQNAVKQMQLVNKWEEKKASGNVLNKDKGVEVMSQEESMIEHFKEQLKNERESSEYSQIYNKIATGQELSPEEEDKLRQRDPKMYMEYKADRMEQEAYERRLKNCKTKEEAERLQLNKLTGKLTEFNSIVNNPHIPKSEKMKEAQRIMGDTLRAAEIFNTFVQCSEYKELPTEEEVIEEAKAENNVAEEQNSIDNIEIQKEPTATEESEVEVDVADGSKQNIELTEVRNVENAVLDEMKNITVKHFGKQDFSARIEITV